jgi:hypothetical protein
MLPYSYQVVTFPFPQQSNYFSGLAAGTYSVIVTDSFGCSVNSSFSILENSPIQVTYTVTDVSCFGGNDGTIDLTVIGGTQPYTYLWSPLGTTTQDISGLPAGSYNVTITDANGCTANQTVVVNEPTAMQVMVSTTDATCGVCNGEVVVSVFGGVPPYVYEYNNGAVQCFGSVCDSLCAGTNRVIVTNVNGCADTVDFNIGQQSSLQIDSIVTTNVSCNGANDGSACVYVSNGQIPYSYVWNNLETTQCASSLGPLIPYNSVTVTDANGCTAVETTTSITEPAPLTAQFDNTSDGVVPDTVLCLVNSGTPPFLINWKTGDTNIGDSVVYVYFSDGIYMPTVTDSNGCTFTDTIVIGAGCAASCVWPGDADGNGIADNNDLLPIGLAYGTTGNIRLQQDIDWYPHVSQDWADTLSSGVNFKHSDCNGNGVINSNDTLAIIQNFGQIHLKNNTRKQWRANETALYVDLTPDTTYAGDTMFANLTLGDVNIPATNVYGLAFTLNYNPIVVDSLQTKITFGNSWLGTATDKISIAKDLSQSGQLKCALTRIDHTTRSGFGQIGQVSFIITTDNINGKDLIDYFAMEVWISDLVMIDSAGTIIPANEGADSTQVEFEPSSVRKTLSIGTLTIQPNPANNEVYLSVSYNLIGAEIKLFDIEGRMIHTKIIRDTTEKLNTSAFANGIYLVQVKNEQGVLTQRLAIAR